MFDQLVEAILSRLQLGETEAAIKKQILDAGHSETVYESALKAARLKLAPPPVPQNTEPDGASMPQPASPSAPPAPTQAASMAPTPPTPEQSLSTPSHSSKGLVIALVVVILMAAAGAAAYFSPLGSMLGLTNLFGGAPYGDENIIRQALLGVRKIESSGFRVSIDVASAPKDSDVYLLPKELVIDSAEADQLGGVLASIPSDMRSGLSVSGNFDRSDERNQRGYSQMSGSFETDDFSFFADVETIFLQDEGVYLKINRMPSMLFFDFSSVKGEWMHVFTHALEQKTLDSFAEVDFTENDESKQLRRIIEIAQNYKLLVVDGAPVEEEVDGVRAYKYTFLLNQPALKAFFTEANETLTREFGEDNILREINEDIDIERFTSVAYTDYVNTHHKLVLWGRSDGIPVKFGIESRVPIDDDFDYLEKRRTALRDTSMKSTISSARADGELYYDRNNDSYAGLCESDRWSFRRMQSDEQAVCNDAREAWAASTVLSDGATFCADSTGHASLESKAEGTVCVEAPFVPVVVEEEPREADRQLNFSFYIELTDINDPSPITAPEGALSPEEVSERNPFIGNILKQANQERQQPSRLPGVPVVRGISTGLDGDVSSMSPFALFLEQYLMQDAVDVDVQ